MKDPEAIERYRALLLGLDEKDKEGEEEHGASDGSDVDLEVEWEPDVKASTKSALAEKEQAAKLATLTPFEKMLEKQAAKRKARKQQAKQRDGSPDDINAALAADKGAGSPLLLLFHRAHVLPSL